MDLPDEYEYKTVEESDSSNHKFIFRVKNVKDEDSALAWLRAYEEKSLTTWRKKRTFPHAGKVNIFKEEYRCQHNTDERYRGQNKRRISKNTSCEATLKIIIRRYIAKSKAKNVDPDVKEYPCMISIENRHNHSLKSAAVLRFRDMAESTKEKLLMYFQHGYSASHARHAIETDLLLQKEDYDVVKLDAALLPSISQIQHLFNSEFKLSYGEKHGEGMERDFQNFLENHCRNTGSKACFKKYENNTIVALTTPIMQRAATLLPQAKELIHVDASGNMDKDNSRVYFFVTPAVAGGIPLGCIIMDNEKEDSFRKGVELLISLLPQDCDFVQFGPAVFMTDDDLKERMVLGDFWRKSKFLLCQFHFLKAVWSWLRESKNNVPKSERQEIYFMVKDMLHSQTHEILEEKWEKILNSKLITTQIRAYLIEKWAKKELWADSYRVGLPIRGNNTNNYIEALFRVLKECVLDRVKALNVVQLTDFILVGFENYLKNRLLDYSYDRYLKKALKRFTVDDDISLNVTLNKETNTYTVDGRSGIYVVDFDPLICTCFRGNTGQLCTHISAVLKFVSTSLPGYTHCLETRKLVYEIALGKCPDEELLQDLSYNPSNSAENCASGEAMFHNVENKPSSESINETEENKLDSPVNNIVESGPSSLVLGEISIDDINETKENLNDFYQYLVKNIDENPSSFVPAVKKMMHNFQKHAKTETAVLSALHNFAKHSNANTSVQIKRKRSGTQIPVQPTAIGRRKTPLTGKRRHLGGRPSGKISFKFLKEHDYSPFTAPPNRRKKAKHNLEDCVLKNISVGRDRTAK